MKIINNVIKKKPDASIWILFAATFLIIVFFLWYFFIYVNSNEKLHNKKYFRVLTQQGENIKKKYESLSTVVKSKDMKEATQNKIDIKKYFFGIDTVGLKPTIGNDYVYFKNEEEYYFKIDKKDFFQPLERKDVFEEIIIIKEDSASKSKAIKNELFYSSFPVDIVIKNLDSLITIRGGLSSGSIADANILGINYKLFFTHIQLKNNESYYVGGVISKDNYVKYTRSINFYTVLLIIVLFFAFLLSIPLIKLVLITENHKLKINDLLLSAFSIIISTFFILLIAFIFINDTRGKANVNSELKNLSDSIKNNLTDEIKKIHKTLELYSDSLIQKKLFNFPDSTYNHFKFVFKLDTDGLQKDIFTSRNTPSAGENFKHRRYFYESGEWQLDGKKLMLDFVYSDKTGEQLGAVSIKKGGSVYAVTSRFYSTINTILPPGYGFCVIDNEGNVKFHSDVNKMLRENFLKETENSDELKGAIYGNLGVHFAAKYLGKNHSCYITPISTLPLYLVTFFDNSYSNSVNLQVTSLTIIFFFLLLLLFFAAVSGTRLTIYRKSDLRPSIDIIEWLRPEEWKMEMYRKSFLSNITAIILIVISCFINDAENTLFIIFHFLLLQILAVYYYTNILAQGSHQKKYLKRQFIPSIFFIISIFYIAYRTLSEINSLVIFCSILILFDYLLKPAKSNTKNSKTPELQALESGNSNYFYRYLFVWLGIIVIVPVGIFSIIFYNHETSSYVTNNLYYYARSEAIRNYGIDKFYSDYVAPSFKVYKESSKLKGVYYPIGISKLNNSTKFDSKESKNLSANLAEILFYFKPDFDSLSTERKSIAKKIADTISTIMRFKSLGDSIVLKHTAYQTYHSVDGKTEPNYYMGVISKFEFGEMEIFILFLLVLSISFIIINKLIKFTSERIFGIAIQKKDIFSNSLIQNLNSRNNLFIQCAGMCDKDIDSHFSETLKKLLVIDYKEPGLSNLLVYPRNNDIIFIKNIHPDFEHPEKDVEKFTAMNKLAENGNKQLVLISNQSIEKLIEIIETKINLGKDEENEEKYTTLNKLSKKGDSQLVLISNQGVELLKPTSKLGIDDNSLRELQILKTLFEEIDKRFVHLYAPISELNRPELIKCLSKTNISVEAKETIEKELIVLGISDDLLKSYAEALIDLAEKNEKIKVNELKEKIILKAQELATAYYENIWESCTNEEKLLLMDMAENLLLNDKNVKVIGRLINKGLLKKNISVDIVNQSFRNFVNSKSEGDYENEFLEVRKTGKWVNYRAPILLIIFAVAFFLALQGDVLTNIASILTVVLSIITVVTKISGIFSGNNGKSTVTN